MNIKTNTGNAPKTRISFFSDILVTLTPIPVPARPQPTISLFRNTIISIHYRGLPNEALENITLLSLADTMADARVLDNHMHACKEATALSLIQVRDHLSDHKREQNERMAAISRTTRPLHALPIPSALPVCIWLLAPPFELACWPGSPLTSPSSTAQSLQSASSPAPACSRTFFLSALY